MQELLKAYNAYIMDEFESEPATLEQLQAGPMGLAYTELGLDNQYPVQVDLCANTLEIKYYLFDELKETEKYKSLQALTDILKSCDFMDYIRPFYDWIPEEEC